MARRRGRPWHRLALVVVGAATLTLSGSTAVIPATWEWRQQLTWPVAAPVPYTDPTRLAPVVVVPKALPSPTPSPTPTPSKTQSPVSHTSTPTSTSAPPTTTTPTTTPPTTTTTSTSTAPPAIAAPAWRQQMPDATRVTLLPDGGVVGVAYQDPASGLSALAGRTPSGEPRWEWPSDDPAQPTGDPVLVDAAGNSYVTMRDDSAASSAISSAVSLVSFDAAGALRWRVALAGPCCPFLALGDTALYALVDGAVVGLDAASGAPTAFHLPAADLVGLATYPGGVAVVSASTGVRYYGPDGTPVTDAYPLDPAVSVGTTVVAGIDGDLYVAGFANPTRVGAAVARLTPLGPAWLWPGPPEAHTVVAPTVTADGGVVLTTYGRGVYALDRAGAPRWSRTLSPPRAGTISGAPNAIADTRGNVTLVYPYEYVPTGAALAHGVAAEFVDQATGAATLTPVDFAEQNCADIRGWLAPSADTTGDRLVLGLLDRCTSRGAIASFTVPGLGTNVASRFPPRPPRPLPPLPADDVLPRSR